MDPRHSGEGAVTRRRLLSLAGGGALGLGLGSALTASAAGPPRTVPFHGRRQAGILTPPPGRLVFAAFDLDRARADDLADLLRIWTDAAARMTAGRPAAPDAPADRPPDDPGEAVGLSPAHLTLTVGFGPGAFTAAGSGLARRRPRPLAALPRLPGERLDPARSGGDLCVQACADDPQVAFHAVHTLAHLGRGAVSLRWLQNGFTRSASGPGPHPTPRNLHGFKDGTRNIAADDAAGLRRHVWVGADEPQRWMRGGTYLVCRRIRMFMERWDRSPLSQQEAVIGRHKDSGAPLGGRREHDPVDLAARGPDGKRVIAMSAHVRVSAPETNDGIRILRRGYSYTDGADPGTGDIDAGLFFICFVRDPHRQFVPLQRRVGTSDGLNDYIEHRSSAVFAIPPGTRPGGFIGEGLFRP